MLKISTKYRIFGFRIGFMLTIDLEIARRFILGRHGLWPGRRWRGLKGTEQAMRYMEYLQLDPLQIIARTQDIKLHSRVLDYKPGMWADLTYKKRKFFDWGGWLSVRPMDELPYWRVVMNRERTGDLKWTRAPQLAREHAAAITEVRKLMRERGTLRNRDFEIADRTGLVNYRGRKDSSLALYYLWTIGEIMTHHREGFERIYAPAESVAPAKFLYEKDGTETDRFLVKKEAAFSGLLRPGALDTFLRGLPHGKAYTQVTQDLLNDGELIEVKVEGWKPVHYALASDAKHLADLIAGRVPKAWKPLETTTTEEAIFVAPFDQTVARGRAKAVFAFDFVMEIYKPAPQRKYGYYTIPILWGDQFVGRFDSKLDRTTNTFVILGLWLDNKALAKNEVFAEALVRGFARFITFLGAVKLDASGIQNTSLRKRVQSNALTLPRNHPA
jgi:uncharacterized protein YcaQ